MHYKKYKKILSPKNGVNLYRGCTHGCIYCDSRSKCYNIDHEFTDIEVKEDALTMLNDELSKKKKRQMISTGSMTDPYLHLEKELKLTRGLLELVLKYKMGINILTKSNLLLRDLNLYKAINKHSKTIVSVTLTTYNEELCSIVEPNVCTTYKRFLMLKKLNEEGIETGVWLCPILPYINDDLDNLKGILNYCKMAKVKYILLFGFGLTLREGNREYYYLNLDKHFGKLKEVYERNYNLSYEIKSPNSKILFDYFISFCKENKIMYKINEIFEYLNKFEEKGDYTLFDL